MLRKLLLIGLLLLFSLPATAIEELNFLESDCQFDEPRNIEIDCGYLIVPLRHENPTSPRIRLHLAILRNPNGNSTADPIIYLEGGPGGSALKNLALNFEEQFAPLFATNRDIIIFDQRGVGLSEPALDCELYLELGIELSDYEMDGEDLTIQEIGAIYNDALRECANDLSANHELSAFNTVQNAADVEALRIALGYEQINLWGISYGTRLALAVMRDYPDHIRSVVIDSVYTPEVNLYSERPANFNRALTVLFDTCAADTACNDTYPNLRAVFYETAANLNANPAVFDAPNPFTGDSFPNVVLDGYNFTSIIFRLLYNSDFLPLLPQMIYAAWEGEYSAFALVMGSGFAQSDTISSGMYWSMQCHEELSFITLAELDASWEAFPELAEFSTPLNSSANIFDTCAAFNSGTAPSTENEAISSDIPTLVTTGEFDPITPPAWGANAAERLSRSTYLNFPYTGHGATANQGCAQDILIAFFQNPENAVDSACIDDMTIFFSGTVVLETEFEAFNMRRDFGIDARIIVPSNWNEQDTVIGLYTREATLLDTSLVRILTIPNVRNTNAAAALFRDTIEVDFRAAENFRAEHSRWAVYPIELLSAQGKLAITMADNTAVVILMLGDDEIYQTVLIPMMNAFEMD